MQESEQRLLVSILHLDSRWVQSSKPTFPKWPAALTSRSPDFARWASVFRPERCLSVAQLPKSGGSSLELAAFWPGRAAFPRGRRTCPAAFVQLWRMDRGHVHDGGVRRRRMAVLTARTIGPKTATSANWKVMARWRTTRAPILDQLELQAGQRPVRHGLGQFAGCSAGRLPGCRPQRAVAAAPCMQRRNFRHDSRVQRRGYLPSLMCCSAVPRWL